MKYAFLSLCLFFTTSLAFAQETKKLTAEKHNEYGLIYSLPQTHLDVEVVATKTTRKAGPYYQYAEKYLGISGAIPMVYPIPRSSISCSSKPEGRATS